MPANQPTHLYIYYRAAPQHSGMLMQQVKSLQNALSLDQGVRGWLMRRPNEESGQITWMEVYTLPCHMSVEAFKEALATSLTATELSRLINGARHEEWFMQCLPET